jgi:hypothetical protein
LHWRLAKVKQAVGLSREMKEQPDVPPMFRSDPEESFSLWMKSCFPGASLGREDAIRQWLATPLGARVQCDPNHRLESAKSNGSLMPGTRARDAIAGASSNETGTRNQKGCSGRNSRLMNGGAKDRSADSLVWRICNNSKLPLKFARCAFLGLLAFKALWATPTSEVAPLVEASIAATQPRTPEPASAVGVPVPRMRKPIGTESYITTGPLTIENLSVGCEYTEPCIEISTRGKGALPRLTTLSDPDRVVMDFQDAVLSAGIHRIAVGRGGVRAVRVREDLAQSPYTRVIIDLAEKCEYELHILTNLVVLQIHCNATLRHAG